MRYFANWQKLSMSRQNKESAIVVICPSNWQHIALNVTKASNKPLIIWKVAFINKYNTNFSIKLY